MFEDASRKEKRKSCITKVAGHEKKKRNRILRSGEGKARKGEGIEGGGQAKRGGKKEEKKAKALVGYLKRRPIGNYNEGIHQVRQGARTGINKGS